MQCYAVAGACEPRCHCQKRKTKPPEKGDLPGDRGRPGPVQVAYALMVLVTVEKVC